ncbi:MAG: beta-L-arabinofuranosidase domain-containing protein [Woeseiaceae bacterium]
MSAAALALLTAGIEVSAALPAQNAMHPFPLGAVRLKPSHFLDAVEANRTYLHRLEPDRLLHNYRKFAGLEPKAEAYGGWEADTIGGHTLGHYLTACALMHAQTGDAECKNRVDYIVSELARCQQKSPDGYVAGFSRRRDDTVENGRVLFDELVRGDIRAAPFNLNGCWVPFYNWHKLFAGLLDAGEHCGNDRALVVATGLGGFIDDIFRQLDDNEVQAVLACEHGGMNESLAELFARTGDERWLKLARRFHHRAVLDPLAHGQNILPHIHSNTQIPKLIGLARLYELTGDESDRAAARFFWETVTSKHSYVIGGNGDREYFQEPDTISRYITEQTCEGCCTYNMLKLTRHLYQWRPHASLFDYYERAHLNHILAQQNPATGMFTYMMPLMSGTARGYSTPFDDFWCCVGSGMESHAKHGDSIFWHEANTLYVNLYIPSTLDWLDAGMRFELESKFPYRGETSLRLLGTTAERPLRVALRVPGWADAATMSLNGGTVSPELKNGYAMIERPWQTGDVLSLSMPMPLRLEPTADDPSTVSVLRGPLVMAADLGKTSETYAGPAPAIVGENVLDDFVESEPAVYRVGEASRPEALTFRPFFKQYETRTAVYFRLFDDAAWEAELGARDAEEKRQSLLDQRSLDVVALGVEASETAHELKSDISYALSYRGKPGRDARTGGFMSFRVRTGRGPAILRATYWGDERRRQFDILVDGHRIASQKLNGQYEPEFVDIDYPLPADLYAGKESVEIRFEPRGGKTAGPVFGCRLLPPDVAKL